MARVRAVAFLLHLLVFNAGYKTKGLGHARQAAFQSYTPPLLLLFNFFNSCSHKQAMFRKPQEVALTQVSRFNHVDGAVGEPRSTLHADT
jgi:hypothetical protein